ncbi:EamA family transporter [Elioraea rosea]|uniref:EamA family transporter n=1 Tax=Elioraea rosea TaxID=2492390 RepID=UPI001182FC5A
MRLLGAHSPLAGVGWMLVAMAFFSVMSACGKAVLGTGLPLPLFMLSRAVVTMLALSPWLLRRGGAGLLATRRPWMHLGRGLCGVASMGLGTLALTLIPLADAIALNQARPLWLLAIAVLFLGEKVGWRRPLAGLIGFAGVLVVAFGERGAGAGMGLNAGTIAALTGSIAGAGVGAFVRRLAAVGEPPFRVVFLYAAVSLVVWTPPSVIVWQTPTAEQALLLVIAAFCAIAGDFCASFAARRAEASLLAPVEFVQVPIGALIGFFAFAERPGWPLFAGASLMMLSVAYIARREAQLARLRRAEVRPSG